MQEAKAGKTKKAGEWITAVNIQYFVGSIPTHSPKGMCSIPRVETEYKLYTHKLTFLIALSPKGKAQDFDSCICWFESN